MEQFGDYSVCCAVRRNSDLPVWERERAGEGATFKITLAQHLSSFFDI